MHHLEYASSNSHFDVVQYLSLCLVCQGCMCSVGLTDKSWTAFDLEMKLTVCYRSFLGALVVGDMCFGSWLL